MRSMRIAHVISAPTAGGAEVYVKDLSIAMAAEGHEVFVAFISKAADVGRQASYEAQFLAELDSNGIRYDFIGHEARRNPLRGWWRARVLLRQWSPDVVHAHLYYGLLFLAFCRIPVVYTHHLIDLRIPKIAYRMIVDKIVTSYVGICGACTRVLKTASAKPVVRIDNGVPLARILMRDKGEVGIGCARLLAVGRLSAQKNYDLLLDAASLLDDLDFSLEIAGEGPLHEHIQAKIQELGLEPKVRLLGNVSDVPSRLAAADVFVMSSLSEGLPIALIEATLTGLPAIVTNVGGCSEVIHQVCNGIVVDDLDAVPYSEALRRLIRSPEQRKLFSENALSYSSAYQLPTAVRRHLELYSELSRTEH